MFTAINFGYVILSTTLLLIGTTMKQQATAFGSEKLAIFLGICCLLIMLWETRRNRCLECGSVWTRHHIHTADDGESNVMEEVSTCLACANQNTVRRLSRRPGEILSW